LAIRLIEPKLYQLLSDYKLLYETTVNAELSVEKIIGGENFPYGLYDEYDFSRLSPFLHPYNNSLAVQLQRTNGRRFSIS
jgi:hypothetical protein